MQMNRLYQILKLGQVVVVQFVFCLHEREEFDVALHVPCSHMICLELVVSCI